MTFGRELALAEDPRARCSLCRGLCDRPGQRYCRACHAAYQRARRPRWSELSEVERQKMTTRTVTNMRVRRGLMERRPCWCGGFAEAHHPDYGRAELVVWLCPVHHRELHRWMREQPVR